MSFYWCKFKFELVWYVFIFKIMFLLVLHKWTGARWPLEAVSYTKSLNIADKFEGF